VQVLVQEQEHQQVLVQVPPVQPHQLHALHHGQLAGASPSARRP
jgi:hypothetical protein